VVEGAADQLQSSRLGQANSIDTVGRGIRYHKQMAHCREKLIERIQQPLQREPKRQSPGSRARLERDKSASRKPCFSNLAIGIVFVLLLSISGNVFAAFANYWSQCGNFSQPPNDVGPIIGFSVADVTSQCADRCNALPGAECEIVGFSLISSTPIPAHGRYHHSFNVSVRLRVTEVRTGLILLDDVNNYIDAFELSCLSGYVQTSGFTSGGMFDIGCQKANESETNMAKNPAMCSGAGDSAPNEGNPINVATGNKYQLESDFTGSSDFALSFSRHYNSLKAFDSVLGQQWRHNYERSLNIDFLASPATISVNRPDGVVYTYTQQSGLWVSDADVIETLTQTSNGYRLMNASNIIEDYDTAGRLMSMTNTRKQTISLSYNSTTSLLETVTDHFGRTLTFAYDSNDRLVSFNDPQGNTYRYEYDTTDNLEKVIYPDSTPSDLTDNPQRLYLYENANLPNHLTGIIDETGARFANWGYDSEGRGIFSEHNNGTERVDIVYNNDGTTTVTDQLGAVRTYTFGIMFGVAKVSQVEGDQCTTCGSNAQVISYDANGFVASRTDFNGNITNFTRDARGLALTRTEAAGTAEQRTITTTWHSNFRLPTEINEPNKTTTFTYDANGNLLSRSETDTSPHNSGSRTTTFTYDSNGQVLTIDGPRTDVTDITTFDYNAQGNRTQSANALGQETQFTSYDASGRLLSMTDANGIVTQLTYDPRGRLLSRTVAGVTTTFDYDGVGQLTQITLPNNAQLNYTYDGARRLTDIEDNLGNRIRYTLDNMGNRTGEEIFDDSNSLRRTQTRVFDELSRLIESISADGRSSHFQYDANGNQTTNTDALNRNSQSAFDALDRLISSQDADSQSTQYSYDNQDNLTTVTDARGLTTTYTYDGLGNLLQLDSPDTGITTYTYDAAGNRISQTDARSVVTTFSYDALNRLTATQYPDSQFNISYTYDEGQNGIGRLTTMTDRSGQTTYQYGERGNLTQQDHTTNGTTFTTAYAYDDADNLIQTQYPTGRTVTMNRDALGRIAQMTTTGSAANDSAQTIVNNLSYLPFGPVTSYTYGNGLSASYSYDQDYRLTSQATANILENNYSYDAVNNITDITDGVEAANDQSFAYDNLDRLSNEAGGYGTRDYQYDALGNRSQRIRIDNTLDEQGQPITQTRTQTYSYNQTANRLDEIETDNAGTLNQNPYAYDAVGNLVGRGVAKPKVYVYGDHNRLTSVSRSGIVLAQYRYNGRGERTIKIRYNNAACTTSAACSDPQTIDDSFIARTFVYHYDQNGQLLGETLFNRNNKIVRTREYVWLNSQPVAHIDTRYKASDGTIRRQNTYYIHSDQLNTPRRMTDQAQTIIWRWDSDAFGQGRINNDPDQDGSKVNIPLRFPGQMQMEGGLRYNYFRDYAPNIGRYITSDPIGLGGGINSYVYVNGNPLIGIDPLGLFCLSIENIQILSAATGGAAAGFLFRGGFAGAAFGALGAGAAERARQATNAGAGGTTVIGALSGFAGSRNRAGAIAGALGGGLAATANQDPCSNFTNTAAATIGGAVGGFAGEFSSPSRRRGVSRGDPIFSAGRGGITGFVGGLVQDLTSAGLASAFACEPDMPNCECR